MNNELAQAPRLRLVIGVAIAAVLMALLATVPLAQASAGCPNEQFRTGAGAALPDCRAYEQVSPQNKNGGNVDGGLELETEPAPEQAAPNGESMTFASQTAFTGTNPKSAPVSSQYLATRGPEGWQTTALDPRQDYPYGELIPSTGAIDESLFQGFSESLQYGFIVAENPPLVPGAPEGHYNPYLRNDGLNSYTLLAAIGSPTSEPEDPTCCGGIYTEYAGMSADGSQVIFATDAALTPEATPDVTNLYEWNEGKLELVSVLPNGAPDTGGATRVAEKSGSSVRFGGAVEQAEQGVNFNFSHAISSDGRRAFWTGSNGRLYMHELVGSGARTVEISASQKTGAPAETGKYAHYWTASEGGSLVYFSSCEQLTNDSTAVEGSCFGYEIYAIASTGQDLYQYDTETGKLTDITVDPHAGKTADVQGVLGASNDGSYVYFAADGVLAEGAVEGAYNIYVWHDGATSLVATLRNKAEALAWDQGTKNRTSRVSENGQFLAFESALPLTGGATTTPPTPGKCRERVSESFETPVGSLEEETSNFAALSKEGERCLQVYEYDSADGRLVCASCGPDGFPPTGSSIVPETPNALQPSEGWESPTHQQHYLTDSGRLFFDSTAALVPQDTNEAEDVYEYEPSGVGGCAGASVCVSLISSGTSPIRSRFVDADAMGDNAFFTTYEKLVGGDTDESGDLYDARVGGGFESQSALPCSGEACKPAIAAAPSIYGAAASQSFDGAGNPFSESFTQKASSGKRKATKKQRSKKKKKTKRRGQKSRARKAGRRAGKHAKTARGGSK